MVGHIVRWTLAIVVFIGWAVLSWQSVIRATDVLDLLGLLVASVFLFAGYVLLFFGHAILPDWK